MSSIFSRIVSGEIPAAKVYEDDQTLAFLDIRPASRGHTLVICKEEYPRLQDMPPELLGAVYHTVQRVAQAIQAAFKPDGFNIVQNDGSAAGQVVFHYHVHVIPRWTGDRAIVHWIQGNPDEQTLQNTAAEIRSQIES